MNKIQKMYDLIDKIEGPRELPTLLDALDMNTILEGVQEVRRLERTLFQCPKCGGDRFGSSFKSRDPRSEIFSYKCHGSDRSNCSWSGTPEEFKAAQVIVTRRKAN